MGFGRWGFSKTTLLSSLLMDVFVIPVGPDRYELYGEQPAETDDLDDAPSSGVIGRLKHRVAVALRTAEERRHRPQVQDAGRSLVGRLQDRMWAWVVERMAEQKLLWSLRGTTAATVAHPEDMTFEQVLGLVRRNLRADYTRHRKWFVIDGVLFVVTSVTLGPLALMIPGVANLPAFYFGFRTIGHFLSMRGAAQGIHRVRWTGRPCPPLAELRGIGDLEPHLRHERVHDVAMRLRLQHLTTFFERIAARPA